MTFPVRFQAEHLRTWAFHWQVQESSTSFFLLLYQRPALGLQLVRLLDVPFIAIKVGQSKIKRAAGVAESESTLQKGNSAGNISRLGHAFGGAQYGLFTGLFCDRRPAEQRGHRGVVGFGEIEFRQTGASNVLAGMFAVRCF